MRCAVKRSEVRISRSWSWARISDRYRWDLAGVSRAWTYMQSGAVLPVGRMTFLLRAAIMNSVDESGGT